MGRGGEGGFVSAKKGKVSIQRKVGNWEERRGSK